MTLGLHDLLHTLMEADFPGFYTGEYLENYHYREDVEDYASNRCSGKKVFKI